MVWLYSEWVLSKLNGTSTPKGSSCAKTGGNDCNLNSSHYSLSTALCESIRYQVKSEQNVRQDLIPRVGHGEAALSTPWLYSDAHLVRGVYKRITCVWGIYIFNTHTLQTSRHTTNCCILIALQEHIEGMDISKCQDRSLLYFVSNYGKPHVKYYSS